MIPVSSKLALIINGDSAAHHQQNVERALKVLKGEGYEVFVANPEKLPVEVDHYSSATVSGIRALATDFQTRLQPHSQVVVYTTGHGSFENNKAGLCLEEGEGCVTDELVNLLDFQKYGNRTIIMDQCYGGFWSKIFVDDPRTLFISQASEDELSSCQEFAVPFWGETEKIEDINHDGKISFQERYAHALAGRQIGSNPKFLPTPGYYPNNGSSFSQQLQHLSDLKGLDDKISALKPGQYAVLLALPPSYRGREKTIKQYLEQAKQSRWEHLFLVTQSPDITFSYNIEDSPKLFVFDHEKFHVSTNNVEDILETIGHFEVSLADRIGKFVKNNQLAKNENQLFNYLNILFFEKTYDAGVVEKILFLLSTSAQPDVALLGQIISSQVLPQLRNSLAKATQSFQDLLDHPKDLIRAFALWGYSKCVLRLPGEEQEIALKELFRLIASPKTKKNGEVLNALASLLPEISYSFKKYLLRLTREAYVHWPLELRLTLAGAWQNLTRFIPISLFEEETNLLLTMLQDQEVHVRRAIVKLCASFLSLKGPLQHQKEKVALAIIQSVGNKELFNLNDDEKYFAWIAFTKESLIALRTKSFSLSPKIAHSVVRIFLTLLSHPRRDVRFHSLKLYQAIFADLPLESKSLATRVFLKLFDKDSDDKVRLAAFEAYLESVLLPDSPVSEVERKSLLLPRDEMEEYIVRLSEMAKNHQVTGTWKQVFLIIPPIYFALKSGEKTSEVRKKARELLQRVVETYSNQTEDL